MSATTDAILLAMQQGNNSVKQKLILALQSSASQPAEGNRVGENG
jgi:hypothetical protein